jgi:thiamine biosynthesis protein ThiC
LKGKKHNKQKERMKQIWRLEKIVSRMADFLIDQIEATKEHVEAKFSKTLDELLVITLTHILTLSLIDSLID